MKYIALLRGINVGGNHMVEMIRLNTMFTALGYSKVKTYLNSGNIVFESDQRPDQESIIKKLYREFGFVIPTLIKSQKEMREIVRSIPESWCNDTEQRTDVAYLFDSIDSDAIIDKLPVDRAFVDIRYTNGALFWHVERKNVNKSKLIKLIGHAYYKYMTIRNINTARTLAII